MSDIEKDFQKSLKYIYEDLINVEKTREKDPSGFKNRLQVIYETLQDQEMKICAHFALGDFGVLSDFESEHLRRDDSGMAQMIKSQIKLLAVEIGLDLEQISININDDMNEFFKLPALEHISKLVGEYFTGLEITELFKKSGHPEIIHDGNTKWRFLYSTFQDLQKNKLGVSIILKFLESVCDPQEYFDRPEYHATILEKLNVILSFYGMKVNDNGSIVKMNKKYDTLQQDIQNVSQSNNKQWDVFISHASEDKETVAKPFVQKLRNLDLNVWYDEFSLKWGKSLRKSIDEGLSNSLFGIVILSKVFFQKQWTQIELDGLISLMISTGHDNILPLRYRISNAEVAQVSPILAGIFSRSWDEGMEILAKEVKELVDERKIPSSKSKSLNPNTEENIISKLGITTKSGKKGPTDKTIFYNGTPITMEELGKIYALICKNEDELYPKPRFKGSDMISEFLNDVRKAGDVTSEIKQKYHLFKP